MPNRKGGRWPGSPKHIHKYEFVKAVNTTRESSYYEREGMWQCAEPYCSHYLPKNVKHRIKDRSSVCWKCGKEMTLTLEAIEHAMKHATVAKESMYTDFDSGDTFTAHPICDSCRNPVREDEIDFGQINPNELEEYLDPMSISLRRINRSLAENRIIPPPTENQNEWCDACQVSHPKNEHML